MRYGSVLQRRLGRLESTIKFKLPNPPEIWNQIQVEALTRMSTEDLRALWDIIQRQAAGITIEDTPENNAVIQRTNAIIAEAQAEYYAPAKKGRATL
jgi:hypothetical protein